MRLDQDIKKYTTTTTKQTLPEAPPQCNRWPCELSRPPGIFQEIIQNALTGIMLVVGRSDDILDVDRSDAEPRPALEDLPRIEAAGCCMKHSKYLCQRPKLVFLGYRIDKGGIYLMGHKAMVTEQIKAIQYAARV